mgnify:FL=1
MHEVDLVRNVRSSRKAGDPQQPRNSLPAHYTGISSLLTAGGSLAGVCNFPVDTPPPHPGRYT